MNQFCNISGKDDLLKFQLSIVMGKKNNFGDFECVMVAGLSILETANVLGFHPQPSLSFFKDWFEKVILFRQA